MRHKNSYRIRLPILYRLLLRLPMPSLQRFPDMLQGIFWSIIAPIFLVCQFFLGLFLLFGFPFPLNLALTIIIPAFLCIAFIRIRLELEVTFLDLIMGNTPYEWNIEDAVNEYIQLLRKLESKNKKQQI